MDRGSNVMWTAVLIPDRQWRSGVGERKDPYGRVRYGIADDNAYYDTVIEAIDLRSKAVIAIHRMNEAAVGFTNDGLLVGYNEPATGEPHIPIWRLRVGNRSRNWAALFVASTGTAGVTPPDA